MAIVFGLDPVPTAVLVPFICFVTGFAFALMGVAISGVAKSINNFSYVTSAVITPLFLLAGTYFPLSALPRGVQVVCWFNPLFHTVQLVRNAVLGLEPGRDLIHLGCLLVFAAIMWVLAVRFLERKLID